MSIPFDSTPRPIDQLTSARLAAGQVDRCSAFTHPEDEQPITQDLYRSWDELSRAEFRNTRICPVCWDKMFAPTEDEEEDEEPEFTADDIAAERYDRVRAARKEGLDDYGN